MNEDEMASQYDLTRDELDSPMSGEEIEALEQAVPVARAIATALHLTWRREVEAGRSPDEDVSPGEPAWQAASAIVHAVHLLRKTGGDGK